KEVDPSTGELQSLQ
nr:Chain B, Sequestosome-1 [synthetic construct]